jgi:hypothetical protein
MFTSRHFRWDIIMMPDPGVKLWMAEALLPEHVAIDIVRRDEVKLPVVSFN